jgi:ABC-type dipeptide/oligopeptide/nickel transport system ATPase subunit
MENINKGKSPFYPGQPVPVELFTGRMNEISRIQRAISQVEQGKPQAIFLTGEYGIGKSSLAGFARALAEINYHLFGIHILLGNAKTIDDISAKTIQTVLQTPAFEPKVFENIRNFLARYVGKQELFGFGINLEVLKTDAPQISRGYLPFLNDMLSKLSEQGIKGLMLIFDEINGIADTPEFAHFIKSLVDENALRKVPVPLLLMLCGVEERRYEMIKHHQSLERIFDIVEIYPMNDSEMTEFYIKAFDTQGIKVNDSALSSLCHYAQGFPKIMHIIGDAVFWLDKDNYIDDYDALNGILTAAEEIGKKFVDHQVYSELHSKDYHSILGKIGRQCTDLSFNKKDLESGLTIAEKKKFNNFLQRMKKLKALKSGNQRGEYVFLNRLVPLYIFLKTAKIELPK